jgi:hypothetical protein
MPTFSALNLILQAAHQSPSADNSQPWRLEWHDQTLSVAFDNHRTRDKTFSADNPATILAMGAVLENIKQAANCIGCPLTWQIPTILNPSEPIYFEAIIGQVTNKSNVPLDTLALFKRHTNRHPYFSQALPETLLNALKNLTLNSARTVVLDREPAIKQAANLVYNASTIRFRTRETHEWLSKSLRFGGPSSKVADGLDVCTLNLPPGGAAFLQLISSWRRMKILNFFGIYKAMSFIDSNPIKLSPALVAVISPAGYQDVLSAGQLMNWIWIDLNMQGVAVHPYYVVADQLYRRQSGTIPSGLENQADLLFENARKLFQLESGEALQMLLRIGYPKKTPVLSKRIPLESVCS